MADRHDVNEEFEKNLRDLAFSTLPATYDERRHGRGMFLLDSKYLFAGADQRKENGGVVGKILEEVRTGTLPVKCFTGLADLVRYGQLGGNPFVEVGGVRMFKDGPKPAWCIVRSMRWEIVRQLEAVGIPCFPSSETIRITGDKGLTFSLACQAGVPQPDAVLSTPMMMPYQDVRYPAILKKTHSGGGNAVFYVTSDLGLMRYTRKLAVESEDRILVQRAMPTGDDMRVQMICGEVFDVMVRHQGGDDFRSNVAFGGGADIVELTAEQEELAHRCAEALPDGAEMSGFMCVDFLFDEAGKAILGEMNPMPGMHRVVEAEADKFESFLPFYIGKVEEIVSRR